MPQRRKRNKSDTRRLPLTFEESPRNVIHQMPSPVFCSDHPVTADVVPLDTNTSIPWVSPQFQRVPTSNNRSRRTRRARNVTGTGPTTRGRKKTSPNQTASSVLAANNAHDKYEPLAFLGQPDLDIHHSNSPETESPSIGEHVSFDDTHISTGMAGQTERRVPVIPDIGGTAHANQQLDFNTPEGHLPVRKKKPKKNTKKRHPKINLPQFSDSEDDRTETLSENEPSENGESNETDMPPNDLGMHQSNADGNSSVLTEQKRPSRSKLKPHKLASCNKNSSEDQCDMSNNENLENNSPSVIRKSGLQHSMCTSSSPLNTTPKPSQRRSLRLLDKFCLNTPPRIKRECLDVLVYDTPEEDYGLTARERMTKYWHTRHRAHKMLRRNLNH